MSYVHNYDIKLSNPGFNVMPQLCNSVQSAEITVRFYVSDVRRLTMSAALMPARWESWRRVDVFVSGLGQEGHQRKAESNSTRYDKISHKKLAELRITRSDNSSIAKNWAIFSFAFFVLLERLYWYMKMLHTHCTSERQISQI